MNFGPQELIVILIIVVLMFGGTQIPRIMRGLGQGIHEFKSAVKDDTKNAKDNLKEDDENKKETAQKKSDSSSL